MAKATEAQLLGMHKLMTRWQNAEADDCKARYGGELRREMTRFSIGAKMFHLILGSSSCFLVDIETGVIYGNKGWLKVDRTKIVGNAYDPNFDAKVLVRDRFRYGHFENAPDGSLRQPIIRR